MLWQRFLTACTGIIPNWKRNWFIIVLAAGAALCLSAVPAKAEGSLTDWEWILTEISQEAPEEISYIVDFFDYNGEFLDSRICGYGEKLEDIKVPEREEDEEYTYRFARWEPELCETVTESAAYMAVYEKIPKDGTDPIEDEELSNSHENITPEATHPEETHPEEPKQISAISYDVVSFVVEKPGTAPKETPPEVSTPIPTEPPAETPAEKPAETPEKIWEEIPGGTPGERAAETPGASQPSSGRVRVSLEPEGGNIHIPRGNRGKSEEGINTEAAMTALERETSGVQEKGTPGGDSVKVRAKSKIREKRKSPAVHAAAKAETRGEKQPEGKAETRQASLGIREPVSDSKVPVFPVVLGMVFCGAVGAIGKRRP